MTAAGLNTVTSIGTISNDDSAAPAGFALNGSTNSALKALLAAAKNGTGFGAIVMKGDSTVAGAGGAVTQNGQSASVPTQLTGAAPYRPSAVLASELSSVGYPAYDNGFVGDNGVTPYVPAATYDPRISYYDNGAGAQPWGCVNDQSLAGGGFPNSNGVTSFLQFAEVGSAFEIDLYVQNGSACTVGIAIDLANPAQVTASGSAVVHNVNKVDLPTSGGGFCRIVATAATMGSHSLAVAVNTGITLVRSVRAVRPSGISILNHASCGAKSTDQAKSNVGGNHFSSLDALAFDAPALTIITQTVECMPKSAKSIAAASKQWPRNPVQI